MKVVLDAPFSPQPSSMLIVYGRHVNLVSLWLSTSIWVIDPHATTFSQVDFAAIELASIGASALNSSGSWSLVSQYPPFKLLFRSDGSLITEGSASCAEMGTKTVLDAGLVPSAQLHVAKA